MKKPGLRFEVSINGRRVGIAGMDGPGVLTAVLCRVKRNPRIPPGKGWSKRSWLKEEIDFTTGGLDTVTDEHLHWLRRRLRVGDRISIRLLPAGKFDPPKGRRRRG